MESRISEPVPLPHPNPTASYWHDPPSRLATYRSTPELPAKANIVIIGSGISGAMIAWNLLQKGETDIVMLEAREAVGGATGRNGGHTKAASYRSFPALSTAHSPSTAARIAALELANIRATHAFATTHSLACSSRPSPTVDIIYSPAKFAQGTRAIRDLQTALGAGHPAGAYTVWGAEAACARFGVAGRNGNGFLEGEERVQGAFEYEAGSISAYCFAAGVLEMCVARGMGLQTRTPVTRLARVEDGWVLATERGEVRAGRVVLATNGYTARLVPAFHRLIVPFRGQIQALRPPVSNRLATPLSHTYTFEFGHGYDYMIPRLVQAERSGGEGSDQESGNPAQHIVIGGGIARQPGQGVSEYGLADDSTLNEGISQYLRGTGKGYFGRNWDEEGSANLDDQVVKEWTGIMGYTLDELPFVGEVPESLYPNSLGVPRAAAGVSENPKESSNGLYISAGFNGHGMALGLKSAEALVEMMVGNGAPEWFPEEIMLTEIRLRALRSKLDESGAGTETRTK